MNILPHNPSLSAIKFCLMALLLTFATPPAKAQTAGEIQIHIGGKVYGGGKNGAINSGNTAATSVTKAEEVALTKTAFDDPADADYAASQASQVTIKSGNIKTVFGGGEQGRSYGKTSVTVNGGTVGVYGDADSANGNVFGAGDGSAAHVYGGSALLVTGGTIKGSVYGGGNEADLVGSTALTLQGGTYVGAVFGGAKMADIHGRTYVNIDGAHAKNDLHIIDVYGGNDIAGKIQPSTNAKWEWTHQANLGLPFELANTDNLSVKPKDEVDGLTRVNSTWNAFILATDPASSTDDAVKTKKVLIDNLYGGGNGDYGAADASGVYVAGSYLGKEKPVIDRTYMQLQAGMYGSVYGGGNAATVAKSTDICLINDTDTKLLTADEINRIKSLLGESSKSYAFNKEKTAIEYAFNRVFGGNNKEPMAIRPNWYLEKATINNLYSGGNAGAMTYFLPAATDKDNSYGGILLAVESPQMTVNNVYGGCRMADVDPDGVKGNTAGNHAIGEETIAGITFQRGYAARVLIKGGNINNVYGGNDVSGNVYYGSQVEILSSINGDVYGAGNGSYAYTDNASLKGDKEWGDYYYDGGAGGLASAQALSIHRPNAAQSYVHVKGTESTPTFIGGAIYCGGNSATLRTNGNSSSLTDAKAELHIGSYVISDKVFLGSNGENMVASATANDALQKYKNGPVGYDKAAKGPYSSLDLTQSAQFEEYMRGVEVAIKPNVSFDPDYVDYSTKFGSLYCGGNVGSMSADGIFTVDFLKKVIIYDKLVGGSNNANVAKTDYNAFHMGGLIGAPDATSGNKVQLNISGLLLEPRVLARDANNKPLNIDAWNKDASGMLQHGNIYGGCYASGYINGGVAINVSANAISANVFAAAPTGSGVTYNAIRDDVLASTLSVYGGGYGEETEIWGDTHVNITGNGQIMKAYGGGEMGVVGKLERDADGKAAKEDRVYDGTNKISVKKFANAYNTNVTLNATLVDDVFNAAKLYGGGFQGLVSGNTTLTLNQGRIYDGFGGASNADIRGVAQTYIGKASSPHVAHNVYGANDFGGQILGHKAFEVDNTPNTMEKVEAQTYVEYVAGAIDGDLFGGPCGAYNYETDYATTIAVPGFTKPQMLTDLLTVPGMLTPGSGVGYAANSFVNVTSLSALTTDFIAGRLDGENRIGGIFGAGEGLKGKRGVADEAGSYVRLASATVQQRATDLAPNVYGAGYCSYTNRSLVDAFTGRYGTLFGGCYGVKYQERIDNTYDHNLTYMGTRSAVRLYNMANENMDIYGAGANSGSEESGVVLHGGQARDVYGASFNEGITYAASVEVPEASTTRVNRIFGGAKGKDDKYACDVYNAYVNYKGANARVKDAIYGGNNDFRMMRNTYMFVHVPVLNFENKLTDVFGGGLGPNTVSLYTEVNLENGAQVRNVYGGGKDGQVLDTPSFRHYMEVSKCAEGHGGKVYVDKTKTYGYQRYLADYEVIHFHDWIDIRPSGKKDGNGAIIGKYRPNGLDVDMPLYHLSTQQTGTKNTNVYIEQGSVVAENAYGGGLGAQALVSGATGLNLHGGVVQGDMYGGGNAGPVKEYDGVVKPNTALGETERHVASTNVYLGGGSTRNVYGGGLGDSADVTGTTNVTMGVKDEGKNQYTTTHNERDYDTVYAGDACVERSLYGGGQQGAVFGTANVTINQGHVGYKYVNGQYVDNLHIDEEKQDGFLDQNGNVFGAGYGEGASVDVTRVNMYGGTVRNSLYGGGEIAAVGQGKMNKEQGSDRVLQSISVAGRTHIYMYNGLVQGDVFGGGRGYSYDLTGNEVVGKTLYTDGYVFGSTDVNIRGGVIGTAETLADGHGNVFGGGNIGYCYTDATKDGKRGDDGAGQGRYYTNTFTCDKCHEKVYANVSPTICPYCDRSTSETDEAFKTTFTAGATHVLSEDTRVIVEPWAQVTAADGVTIDGKPFAKGDYVPAEYLNKLGNKNSDNRWNSVSPAGVTIRNAVFAGGNVSAGSDKVYANAYTVFGNATASVADIFQRDLITLGTDHVGGIYGDGNLTFVDGYRELNISNFGTDYYGQSSEISFTDYEKLTDRERAYFELRYKCVQANSEKAVDAVISQTEYDKLDEQYKNNAYWTPYGFCNIYAGRILNTIQRADFCGVFGSRLVLQGAQDRVPEVVDYTNYTINRVGEVSLNKKTVNGETHGNYFGLYNVVNYMGALTSDVAFSSTRTTSNTDGSYAADGKSFYEWKYENAGNRKRNNGSCHNKVALASGVYLEIVQEQGSTKETKNYGYITGVVELDLINVMPGLGGGYVYAKNEHGAPSLANAATGKHENLSIYNQNAVNNSAYLYTESDKKIIETSGNFIHSTKQIIDDCFPGGGQYMDDGYKISPAHYWYIKGEIYVYDQYVSAYTGSSTAYMENIDLPLTITAASHGKLDLLNIKKNKYAYYKEGTTPLGLGETIVVNNITYGLNDVISYWDWIQLSTEQQALFVDETYTVVKEYREGGSTGTLVPVGTTLNALPSDYGTKEVYDTETESMVPLSFVLRPSNNVQHENGYALSVDLTNPMEWDRWYSPVTGGAKENSDTYKANEASHKSTYLSGPTYSPTQDGVYGQRLYHKDDVITKTVYTTYEGMKNNISDTQGQADAKPTYISTAAVSYNDKNLQAGVGISKDEYDALPGTAKTAFEPAYTCTSTYEADKATNELIYFMELISQTRYNELKQALITAGKTQDEADKLMKEHFDEAYSITKDGLYGGNYFEATHNYRALESWSSLASGDRDKFQFNYDALDVLYDSSYPGNGEINNMDEYDKKDAPLYQLTKPVDYKATWKGDNTSATTFTYTDKSGATQTITKDQEIGREAYEAIPNEKYHYVSFQVKQEDVDADPNTDGKQPKTFYIVKEQFAKGDQPYLSGQIIDASVYNDLDGTQKSKVGEYTFTTAGTYYFCRDPYDVNEHGEGKAFTDVNGTTHALNANVPAGTIITEDVYNTLPNKQTNFEIHGYSPIETTTLFVSRESDIYDLSKDRIVTVVYQYQYEESDEAGHIEQITERHVINIHLQFKSGVPTIGVLQEPAIVLPGETVGLKLPNVSPGAYEILGGGWELFTSQGDAEKHQNGVEYINNATKMYWYQNDYYVAYFAKTYLGKTYSNAVQFKVANYHDIADVMADTQNYMFIDHPDVERDSKIYINSSTTDNDPSATKSEIDMLYDLFQVSLESNKRPKTVQKIDTKDNPLYYVADGDHAKEPLEETTDVTPFPVWETKSLPVFDDHARNCQNLEFHITSDVATKKANWQPIGTIPNTAGMTDEEIFAAEAASCFRGHVHGHGMTISGINNSLFENLCGDVYNLGVTGSFTKSGIADKASSYKDASGVHPGMAQNCWIHTTGQPETNVLPVIGTKNVLNDVNDASGIHTFNCFYPRSDGYNFSSLNLQPYQTATERPMRDFNNGSVAFDLNGFYLHKRYADQIVTKTEAESKLGQGGSVYKYWIENADGTLQETPSEGYYTQGAIHKYGTDYWCGYVENIYADGDFVYAMGEIPTETNERLYKENGVERYLPIWPDDYLFFGQTLTYGYDEQNRPYQPLPSATNKTKDIDHRLNTTEKTNVVFRAPAYYRSGVKDVVHFNPSAVFANHIADGTEPGTTAYPDNALFTTRLAGLPVHQGLTAIDFTGYNDIIKLNNARDGFEDIPAAQAYTNGPAGSGHAYSPNINFAPALNFTTLLGFQTHGITQNLLTYAPSATDGHAGHKNTNDILTSYFNEPEYANYYNKVKDEYRTVNALSASDISGIHGHVVQKNGAYVAHTDHFLVDRQDFNAPIAYKFDSYHRMWYQRKPDNYADMNKGWEGVSLPFAAELVSTQDKGEITHFYKSAFGDYVAGYNSGHEYWLREFTGIANNKDTKADADPEVTTASMTYPVALDNAAAALAFGRSAAKTVTNTFLWDYYYNADGKDLNDDDYRYAENNEGNDAVQARNYYAAARTYQNYPLSVPGKPYIAGFPGYYTDSEGKKVARYYEFDLSGTFVPEHSGTVTPAQLAAQTISFVSDKGITIRVSDEELADANAGMITQGDATNGYYSFYGNYLNVEADASIYATVEEYNTAKSTSLTEDEFKALSLADKRKANEYCYYVLNGEGSAFEATTAEKTPIGAFRPFFAVKEFPKLKARQTRSIVFGMGDKTQFEPDEETLVNADGGLNIYAKKGKIIVESQLDYDRPVRIVTLGGIVISSYTICPGEKVETAVDNTGIYIVNRKKLAVK